MDHFWTGFDKTALLKSDVELQPHQVRVRDKLNRSGGLLLYHGLGSGKTLSSIGATQGDKKVDVVVPASLRPNFHKEVKKYTTGYKPTVMSYEAATKKPDREGDALIIDEAHALNDQSSKRTRALMQMAKGYDKRVLLTGSPIKNRPSEIAPLMAIARGDEAIPVNPQAFDAQYVQEHMHSPGFFARVFKGAKPGVTYSIKNKDRFAALTKGYVDYHHPSTENFPSVSHELISTPMDEAQMHVYDYLLDKASPAIKYKVRSGLPPSKAESKQLNAFLSGVRQASNSAAGYGGPSLSPKIKRAVAEQVKRHKSDPNFRGLVYSNYLESGLNPMSEALTAAGIKHGVFNGELNDKGRKELVEAYNSGKMSSLLISGAGAQGLDLKGVKLVQLLDPHFNNARLEQATGRAVRYKSHDHLPENERHVEVQRFQSSVPQGALARFLGMKKDTSSDEYIAHLADEKDKLSRQFLDVLKSVGQK